MKAYSRVTILKAISRLLEKGVVIKVPKDKKGRINHLYVNYKDAIFSLQENLGIFHYYYLGLIDKVIEVICSKLSEKGKIEYKIMSCVGLLYKLLELYKLLCIVYITSDIFLWSKRPLDNDTLHSKFEHFFNTMKDIHLELRKIPAAMRIKPEDGEEIVCNMLCSSRYGGSKQDLLKMLKYFERYNLCKDFEPVVDSFWVLSYSILPSIDSTYKKHQKNGTLRDWREIFKGSYHPKTEQDRALFQPGTDLEEGA